MADHPDQPIRRFDVFAEYSKLKAMRDGTPHDEAEGYGIWLAKVVASRSRRPSSSESGTHNDDSHPREHTTFRSLGGEPQTDATFKHDIVDRMGTTFYRTVFAPAIAERFVAGDSYEKIRDSIRRTWKPKSG